MNTAGGDMTRDDVRQMSARARKMASRRIGAAIRRSPRGNVVPSTTLSSANVFRHLSVSIQPKEAAEPRSSAALRLPTALRSIDHRMRRVENNAAELAMFDLTCPACRQYPIAAPNRHFPRRESRPTRTAVGDNSEEVRTLLPTLRANHQAAAASNN